MRERGRTIGAWLGALVLAAVPAVAEGAEKECTGELGRIIVDTLRVPDRATCTLKGTQM